MSLPPTGVGGKRIRASDIRSCHLILSPVMCRSFHSISHVICHRPFPLIRSYHLTIALSYSLSTTLAPFVIVSTARSIALSLLLSLGSVGETTLSCLFECMILVLRGSFKGVIVLNELYYKQNICDYIPPILLSPTILSQHTSSKPTAESRTLRRRYP